VRAVAVEVDVDCLPESFQNRPRVPEMAPTNHLVPLQAHVTGMRLLKLILKTLVCPLAIRQKGGGVTESNVVRAVAVKVDANCLQEIKVAASDRRWHSLKYFKEFHPEAKNGIWPLLSYTCLFRRSRLSIQDLGCRV